MRLLFRTDTVFTYIPLLTNFNYHSCSLMWLNPVFVFCYFFILPSNSYLYEFNVGYIGKVLEHPSTLANLYFSYDVRLF